MVELDPTPPAACGLALALPLDCAAIERAMDGGPYSDYVGRALSHGTLRSDRKHRFEKVAAAARALASEAAALGVTVAGNATLEDLRRLFVRCAVVTVVAHWRGPELEATDIRLDPLSLIDRIARERSAVAELIRQGLPDNWRIKVARARGAAAQISLLAEVLDRRIHREPCLVAAPEGLDWEMDRATLAHANRATLEDWWPAGFAPANRLELADGLHRQDRIAACVPPAWAGVADLSNCKSAHLIESVKQQRSDRIVIANERETNPLRRMALLRITYDLLAKGRHNYAEVRVRLSEAMMAKSG